MIRTRLLRVDPACPDPGVIEEAAMVLRRGGLLAFPTETVYGLGAHALDPAAVRAVFAAKGRPADNPLIVHTRCPEEAFALARALPEAAVRLAEAFWPGPLTLVVEADPAVPRETTAGLPTVAVRIPAHPVALALLEAAGVPVAAPSANLSGRPSPTRAEHVLEDLEGRIDGVLDGGETGVGVESTVIDVTVTPPVVLRPGGVSREELEAVIGPVREAVPAAGEAPRSPGLKYRHYAPRARAVVVRGSPGEIARAINQVLETGAGPSRAAFLLSDETAARLARRPERLFLLGGRERPEEAARRLYRGLREVDLPGVELIVMEAYPEAGIGRALMDRMRRAAGGREMDAGALAQRGFEAAGGGGETAP
ncbi:MAG: threonylcarbamoyl-AMP synthase [Firmicutes bacterium]|nr:threonylcarbamoyl-AMP synthase [Bacillota bacterium]MBO2521900.1 threonylcarbamoyl-AMP synthase [Bacillota bacterium]